MPTTAQQPSLVILAAGRGTRLGGAVPKPLTPVGADGEHLIGRQLRLLAPLRDAGWAVTVVVGHRQEELRAALPDAGFVVNERYAETNTSKSLLCALEAAPGAVLWLNADVLFSEGFAAQVVTSVRADADFVGVVHGRTADEEVKFTLDDRGWVSALSKQVVGGLGEAIGVNHVCAATRPLLVEALRACADGDYFEAGVEATVAQRVRWAALDLTEHFAVEVDFPEDLERAVDYAQRRAGQVVGG